MPLNRSKEAVVKQFWLLDLWRSTGIKNGRKNAKREEGQEEEE
jgi:hypothetical protein